MYSIQWWLFPATYLPKPQQFTTGDVFPFPNYIIQSIIFFGDPPKHDTWEQE